MLADATNTLFPTELAVKTYVDTQIAASDQTIVSADAGNSITASGTDGGAFYDDSALQTSITANTTAIGTKEDSANKSNDGTLAGNSSTEYPTEQAVKTYVDNVAVEVALSGQVLSTSSVSTGLYTISNAAITTSSIIQLTVEENVSGDAILIQLVTQNNGDFSVRIYEFTGGGPPTLADANWQYIVINP